MYQVTIKGRNLCELKKAVADIHNELVRGGVVSSMEHDMSAADIALNAETPIGTMEEEVITETLIPVAAQTIATPMIALSTPVAVDANAELDKEGIPWDARIHTKMKTKTAKNVWKLIRSIDQNLVAQVKNELRASVGTVVNAPVAAPVVETPVQAAPVVQPLAVNPNAAHPVQAPVVTPVQEDVQPMSQPIAVPAPVINTNGGHTLETFTANFPMILSGLISEGKVTQDYINQLNTHFKTTQIWDITPEQKAMLFAQFVQGGIITQVG